MSMLDLNKFEPIILEGEKSDYEISNVGVVRRLLPNGNYFYLQSQSKGNNYVSISLRHKGKYYTTRIHRLVAKIFIQNPNNYPQVNHLDCNKSNNKVNNLEWCDCKHNINHAFSNGLIGRKKGTEFHKYDKGVNIIDNNTGKIYPSVATAARDLNIPRTTISAEINGLRPKKLNISRI